MADFATIHPRGSPLLPNQRALLYGYAIRGRSLKELSTEWGCSIRTAEYYSKSLQSRLGARNLAHALVLAISTGQFSLEEDYQYVKTHTLR